MAISAMALLQQHDARRDILIEPAGDAAACSDRSSGHSQLGAFGTAWGRNRAVKTNRLVAQLVTRRLRRASVIQEAQLSLRDRATRACQLKSGKVLHKCRRLVFEKL